MSSDTDSLVDSVDSSAHGSATSKSHTKDYRFFRSFSVKVDNWPIRKAEQLWRRLRDHKLAEIEATEACKWLRAAGFPQYAQMYEDHQFPIDLSSVQKDHPFLELDSFRSLFRRLDTLNRCAKIKVDSWRSNYDDSEEENQCALSENWTFQHDQKRWSRIRANEPLTPITLTADNSDNIRFEEGKHSNSRYGINLLMDAVEDDMSLARSGSERLKDGAKALLRRVESLKSRRRKRQNREGVVNNRNDDVISVQHKMNCLEIPTLVLPKNLENDLENSSSSEDTKNQNSPNLSLTSPLPSPRRLFVHSPILYHCREATSRRAFVNRRGSVSLDRRDTVEVLSDSEIQRSNKKSRNMDKAKYEQSYIAASDHESDVDETEWTREIRSSWHSFQRGILRITNPQLEYSISSLACGQLQVLRKLALLKLTALIEKYCPTHKTGWNWELPKFIKKIKTPDYKCKLVFGVPLSIVLQRTGNPLPKGIEKALQWLRHYALDQVGLFRKPGVRSRILSLKIAVEQTNDFVIFDDQQAYDVADMVKQYFRELPEALLTTKLSETLILIFQHVPNILRREAVSCVLLLMPNEHCEVLQYVLDFLQAVSEQSSINQMTASNIALCLAPSLFYYNQSNNLSVGLRAASVSPRRRKGTGLTGTPDIKELSENKAAYECLLYLISNQRTLFTVPSDMMGQCKFTHLDESIPMPLSKLGDPHGWRNYMDVCIHAVQKEAKDRARGWICSSGNSNTEVEVAYRKVGDGHPLRLWRITIEVEAPPQEVLRRVLRERHIWDKSLIRLNVIQQLDAHSEVYQFGCSSINPIAIRDYCILRTWKTDLPRGACVIVETSVEHKEAELTSNSVRSVILASRYLIEPCGSGKSRLMHLSRIDFMGRTPEWYNKNYGHLCKLHLCEIRSSFKHSCAIGPESKV